MSDNPRKKSAADRNVAGAQKYEITYAAKKAGATIAKVRNTGETPAIPGAPSRKY